ncbi:MAG: hypothetical protein ACREXW_01020 [Gammaproteobacteria bacterium]
MAEISNSGLTRQLVPGGTWGNLTTQWKTFTLAAAAVADFVKVALIPAGSVVHDARFINAALGASTTVKWGYKEDGGTTDDAYFLAATATNAAGNNRMASPKRFLKDTWIIATVGGAAATGVIEAVVDYVYEGI